MRSALTETLRHHKSEWQFVMLPLLAALLYVAIDAWQINDFVLSLTYSVAVLPFAPALWLWLRVVNTDHAKARWQPLLLLVAAGAFAESLWAEYYGRWLLNFGTPKNVPSLRILELLSYVMFVLGVVCAAWARYDARTLKRWVLHNPRATVLMVVAAFAAIGYKLLNIVLWKQLGDTTALLVYYLLRATELDISIHQEMITYEGLSFSAMVLRTLDFGVNIYPPCSGLEGVALLFCLLSMVILFDWKHFREARLLDYFLIGFLMIFVANVLRIALIFVAGLMVQASPLLQAWGLSQDIVVDLFHYHAGWLIYLVVTSILINYIYARQAKNGRQDN